jgi:hypothetical protein
VASFSERVNVDFAAFASVSVGYGTKLRRRQRRPENRTGNGAKDPLDRRLTGVVRREREETAGKR